MSPINVLPNGSIEVLLSSDELYQAAIVGSHRRISCLRNRKTAQHYDSVRGDEWATEIESCCAELAVSKFLNRYWSGGAFDGERAAFDVDGKQVRHTPYKNGSLIIYPEDKPDDKFILVVGKAPIYTIKGWILGREAIEKGYDHQWWKEPANKASPSWWVPQLALRLIPTQHLEAA